MRLPFITTLSSVPVETVVNHAAKIKECTWFFQQAFEAFLSDNSNAFEERRQDIIKLKMDADALQKKAFTLFQGKMLSHNKTGMTRYIIKQHKVLDAVLKTINWASATPCPNLPESMQKEFFLLSDAVIEPVEELKNLAEKTGNYIVKPSDKLMKKIIGNIEEVRHLTDEAKRIEYRLNKRIIELPTDQANDFTRMHLLKLNELTTQIAIDAAETALAGLFLV